MKKKIAIISASCAAVVLAIALFAANYNPLKNTEWNSNSGQLKLGMMSYEWTYNDNKAVGTYRIYKGWIAKRYLAKYVKTYLATVDDSIPDDERYGFENEIEKFKNELDGSKSFILEERLTKTIVAGEETISQSSTYLVQVDTETGQMFLTNIANYHPVLFSKEPFSYSKEDFSDYFIDDDPIIDIDLNIPNEYHLLFNADHTMIYITKDDKHYIEIDEMEETPLYGIIDEYPDNEKFRDGYKAVQQNGAEMTYAYLYENGSTLYVIKTDTKKVFDQLF